MPVGGAIDPACDDALRELERRGHPVWRVRGYSAVDAARNQMATDALAQGFDELMWIDADIVFHPDDVERLRTHNLPFTCGLYPKKGPRQFACEFLPGTPSVRFGKNGGGKAVSPTNSNQVVPDPGSVGSVDSNGVGTIYGDMDPAFDDCSDSSHTTSSPVGVMTGQNIEIKNSDPTNHNIHPQPSGNQEWNESQPPGSESKMHNFARQEVMIPVKCNIHPWMRAYIAVFKHPYFAVSDKDGKFEIKNLPPGTYTIKAWHEKLGTQTQKITVAGGEAKSLDFAFKSGS